MVRIRPKLRQNWIPKGQRSLRRFQSEKQNSEGRILRGLESDKDEERENVYSNFQEDTKDQLFLLQKLPNCYKQF